MILTLCVGRYAFRFWAGSDVAKALSTVRTKVMGGRGASSQQQHKVGATPTRAIPAHIVSLH